MQGLERRTRGQTSQRPLDSGALGVKEGATYTQRKVRASAKGAGRESTADEALAHGQAISPELCIKPDV